MLPATQNENTVQVQLLHDGVTKKQIFKEFKKFGLIKSLKHFDQNKSALVEFSNPEEAKAAKSNQNQLKNNNINIVNNELKQKMKYNLFMYNVPSDIETCILHNFMSKYGEITFLLLKKNEENKNLGYGYVEFETEEAYNKILKEHEQNGKISLPNSNISFNIQKFNSGSKQEKDQNKSALVEFSNPEEANTAKPNYNQLQNKNINIVNNELKQKMKYNLFIHNVPSDIETCILHNFMSKYGEITSLLLKKNEENKNLGYGYVEFETEEAYNKILKEHEQNGKIYLPYSNISFNIQKFNSGSKQEKSNNITILGLFEHEIPDDQKDEKLKQINQIFEQVKNELQIAHFNFYTDYNQNKNNFCVKINFEYDDDTQEEHIFKTVQKQVQKNFSYQEANNKGPTIIFDYNESCERNLFFQGVKIHIQEQDIADWIQNIINVKVPTESIKIKKRFNFTNSKEQKTNNVTVFLDSKADGQKLMIFCSKQLNKNFVDKIFENRRKITIYMKKNEQEIASNLVKKITSYQQNSAIGNNKKIQTPNTIAPQFQFFNPFNMNPPNFIKQQQKDFTQQNK
ncbi:hypothetical protein ABPG72_005035 [Tetrahymena utriculariae]